MIEQMKAKQNLLFVCIESFEQDVLMFDEIENEIFLTVVL